MVNFVVLFCCCWVFSKLSSQVFAVLFLGGVGFALWRKGVVCCPPYFVDWGRRDIESF